MKFNDIPAEIVCFRVKNTGALPDHWKPGPVFSVEVCGVRPGEFEVRTANTVFRVRPVMASEVRRLEFALASGRAHIGQLDNPAVDDSMDLQMVFFTGEPLEMGDIDIGVDEYVQEVVSRLARRRRGMPDHEVYNYLQERCCLRHGDFNYFFLLAGPAIDDDLRGMPAPLAAQRQAQTSGDGNTDGNTDGDADADADSPAAVEGDEPDQPPAWQNRQQVTEPTRRNSICIVGNDIRFVGTETAQAEGVAILTITKLTKPKKNTDRALRLGKGKLAFVDWTRAGIIQTIAKAQMSALTRDDGSYLKKWDEFGDLEGETLLEEARKIGSLQYSKLRQNRAREDGRASVTVHIDQADDSTWVALEEGKVPELDFVESLPDYLETPALSFRSFADNIEQQAEKKASSEESEYSKPLTSIKILDFDKDSKDIILGVENLPAASGTLIMSLAGEIAQIKRRMSARKALLGGRAANPQLGLLIEAGGKITSTRPSRQIQPLTAFVRHKVFRNPPTLRQEQAVATALNTPDIAIIQGPPGTGKTTVIAAILERLNEMAEKKGASIKGQVLLTGFQHDAVENMINRLSPNGLPVPKYGKRSDATEDDSSAFERNLEEWCGSVAAQLRAQNSCIDEVEQETDIRTLCLQYMQLPSRTLAAHLAGKVATLGVEVLGEKLARHAVQLAKRLSQDEQLNGESDRLLDAVRRLRVNRCSFEDDGPQRAADALGDLAKVMGDAEVDLLEKASLWRPEDGDARFLDELAALKNKWLVRLSTRPAFRVEKHNDEIIALAEEAIACIKRAGRSAKDKKSAALAEFLAELECNPQGMMEAVSEYSFAFAATCQQSVNGRMKARKKADGDDDGALLEYEYVIVDEAARVSPRDLMVPLVQGKRVVLVGDHRQLPHIIDEKVAVQMMEKAESPDQTDWLKKSMFQYLFSERLKTLEDTDGNPRRVTLDKQYRMHPELGDFISRNFYERFDPSEKFGSGRPASDFSHHLPGTDNKPAAWLDVPLSKGKHQRAGTSWTRLAEANAIARQLQEWMECDAGKHLTFGVISFYKAQAELIKRQLGIWADGDKRLRIGTVDSFQGMEFDVVFLSMVKTSLEPPRLKNLPAEDRARSMFGHLCLYNRLNVSMSRQERLLVVAGDSGLLAHELASVYIPGLVNYLDLCKTRGRVLQCP